MNHDEYIRAAHELAPLISERARDAEIARRPDDEVIEAVRDSGLFSMMVPKRYGGDELDRHVLRGGVDPLRGRRRHGLAHRLLH